MEQHQENQTTTTDNQTIIVIKNKKSVGLAILLTILFGPLGMLYSTVLGAIIMSIVSIVIGFLTLGIGLFFIWPIYIIWGALAASKTNNQVIKVNKK